MAALEDTKRTAEFLVSEANGYRSRDVAEFDSETDWASAAIVAGQVYAVVGGATVAFDGDGVDGPEVAAGILFEGVAVDEVAERTVINADAEVELAALTYTGTGAQVTAALAALGIKTR